MLGMVLGSVVRGAFVVLSLEKYLRIQSDDCYVKQCAEPCRALRREDLLLPEGVREGFQLLLLLSLRSESTAIFEAVLKFQSNISPS